MRNKYILVGLVGMAVGVLLASVVVVLAGTPAGPGTAPGATFSYTLEDIYARLVTGTVGTRTVFTEPLTAPGVGTGHTLDQVMAEAPEVDDTHGATETQVLTGTTVWGLTSGAWGVLTGTLECGAGGGATCEAGVPKTGQTECYKSASTWETCTCGTTNCPSDQDGDLEKGVAWPIPRFITGTTGTTGVTVVVTDRLTGLIWLQDANCIANEYPGFDADGQVTWQKALTFTAGITVTGPYSNCAAGFSDWRLPHVRELYSLIHYGFANPAVPNTLGTGQLPGSSPNYGNGDPFNNVQSSYYWSSTTHARTTNLAWRVFMPSGYVDAYYKTNASYVWPVRGGQ